MGTKGRQIVEVDIEKLIEVLNRAFADEWLAYYQYWLGPNCKRSQEGCSCIGIAVACDRRVSPC